MTKLLKSRPRKSAVNVPEAERRIEALRADREAAVAALRDARSRIGDAVADSDDALVAELRALARDAESRIAELDAGLVVAERRLADATAAEAAAAKADARRRVAAVCEARREVAARFQAALAEFEAAAIAYSTAGVPRGVVSADDLLLPIRDVACKCAPVTMHLLGGSGVSRGCGGPDEREHAIERFEASIERRAAEAVENGGRLTVADHVQMALPASIAARIGGEVQP